MSRIEKLLKAIINNTTYDEPRLSRIEEIFYSILNSLPYNANAQSRIEALLLALKESGLYDERTLSRIEEILKCKLDGRTYTGWIGSRVEMLLNEWELSEIIEATFTSFPIIIKANGEPLLDYTIYGNMSQSGTPTQETPIQPQGTGERTGNLFDYVSYFDSTFTNYNQFFDYAVLQLSANTTYTFSTSYIEVGVQPRNTSFIVAKPDDVPTTASGGISSISPITITTGSDGKLRLYKRVEGSSEHPTKSQFDNGEWLMLNTGDTALPYEPYGYKLDISSGGVNLAPPLTDWVDGYISSGNGGVHVPTETREKSSDFIRVEPNSVYVFSYENGNFPSGDSGAWRVAGLYDANKQFISRVGSANSLPLTITTTAETVYIRLSFRTYGGSENAMLNLGSTPLPYEPYNRTTTPVYLGEVETTRKIKKLVLTGGGANWYYYENATGTVKFFYLVIIRTVGVNLNNLLNTHGFNMTEVTQQSGNILIRVYAVSEGMGTVEEWKAYLAAQYAAGTPVTVWYVLATPEITIINEPLRKIGDYADTVSMEQAGVEIPTLNKPNNTVIDVETTLKPSKMYVKYNGEGKRVYITADGKLYITSNNEIYILKR